MNIFGDRQTAPSWSAIIGFVMDAPPVATPVLSVEDHSNVGWVVPPKPVVLD